MKGELLLQNFKSTLLTWSGEIPVLSSTVLTDLQEFEEINFASRHLFVFSLVYRLSVLSAVWSQAAVSSLRKES